MWPSLLQWWHLITAWPLRLLFLPLFSFPVENRFPLLKGCLSYWAFLWLIILIVRLSTSSVIAPRSSCSILASLAILFLAPLVLLINSNFMASLMALMSVGSSFCIMVILMAWLTPIRKHLWASLSTITWRYVALYLIFWAAVWARYSASYWLSAGGLTEWINSRISVMHLSAKSLTVSLLS